MKKIPLLISTIISLPTWAMNLDTMLLIGDEYGNGVFTLENSEKTTEFIQSNITQLKVNNNKLERTPYTDENFEDWRVTLTHPKLILEAGRQKQVGVRSLCGNKCDFSEDQYYLVSFEPSPYTVGNQSKPAVSINFGYRPLFVIPAQSQDIKYSVSVRDNKLHIHNTGNSFIKAYVDQCSDQVTNDCETTIMSLSGRERSYALPKNIVLENLEVTIVNHDESYKEVLNVIENN